MLFYSVGLTMMALGYMNSGHKNYFNDKNVLSVYELSGGAPGFCERVVVYQNGSGEYVNYCSNIVRDVQLDPETFDQLSLLSYQMIPFTFYQKQLDAKSGVSMRLFFNGKGKLVPYQLQKDIILHNLNELAIQNRLAE